MENCLGKAGGAHDSGRPYIEQGRDRRRWCTSGAASRHRSSTKRGGNAKRDGLRRFGLPSCRWRDLPLVIVWDRRGGSDRGDDRLKLGIVVIRSGAIVRAELAPSLRQSLAALGARRGIGPFRRREPRDRAGPVPSARRSCAAVAIERPAGRSLGIELGPVPSARPPITHHSRMIRPAPGGLDAAERSRRADYLRMASAG